MAKKQNGAVEGTQVERELLVPMTDEAVEARADELAALVNEQKEIEDLLREYGSDKRKRLREIKARQRVLAQAIATHKEAAMVQCAEEQVFAQNKVVVRRLDTGEVVETRAMSGDERQLSIVGGEV